VDDFLGKESEDWRGKEKILISEISSEDSRGGGFRASSNVGVNTIGSVSFLELFIEKHTRCPIGPEKIFQEGRAMSM